MRKGTRILFALLTCFCSFSVFASAESEQEIAFLFQYLKTSGCTFNRNGTWYSAEKAVEHIQKKYQHLTKKGMIDTTEDFIKKAASESSISGEPYLVKCGNAVPSPSADWFTMELQKYRSSR
ncbi:MAG TPA: DUF5329 domain-containing protein [Gammaproteobacteria bacterium]